MPTRDGSAQATSGVIAQHARRRTALEKLCSSPIELPTDPAARDEFFARLLPDIDAAWAEAMRLENLDPRERALLLQLRKGAEHAAEHIPHRCEGLPQNLQLFAAPVLIKMDDEVPESQVDYALAAVADAAPNAMTSPPAAVPQPAAMTAFFRYQDLVAVPLAHVYGALARAAPNGNPAMALRWMQMRAQPSAARRAPIYLRFVVGVALTESEHTAEPQGSRWSTLEDVVQALLSARLRMPVEVKAAYRPSFYGAAHDGLRMYQAARLSRIVAATEKRRPISARLDWHDAGTKRRARLTLCCGRSTLMACMLQIPSDEGPSEIFKRIVKWMNDHGVADATTFDHDGAACDESHTPILAVPV